MRSARAWTLALALAGVAGFAASATSQPAGLSNKDCQVVRTCNFARGGSYRGCLSSYTCRVCRFVASNCYVDGSRRVCQRMRCTWGG